MPTSSPWMPSWLRSGGSTRSGSSAMSSATGLSPTGWSPGCARPAQSGFAETTTRLPLADRRSSTSTGTRGGRLVEGEFSLVHGSPRDPTWEYITTAPVAQRNLEALDTPYGLHGHTHLPAVFRDDDGRLELLSPSDGSRLDLDGRRLLANPGSVGQPRDGDPRASALVLELGLGRPRLVWHRVAYDIAATQAAMRRRKLPDRLIERLDHGL